MLHALARNWWALLIRGICAVLFGILAMVIPGVTGIVLVVLFGVYALLDGIFAIVSAFRAAQAHERWTIFALEGVVGIVIAAITFYSPLVTAIALYVMIAVWAIITGILEIVAAVQVRQHISNEWLLILAGVLSIAFGVLLFIYPAAGALTVIYLIGIYALFFGVLMIGFSLRLRKFANA